jgi:hypothetical protein
MSRSLIKRVDRIVSAVPLPDAAALAGVDVQDIEQLVLAGWVFCGATGPNSFYISCSVVPQLKQLIRDNLGHRYDVAYRSRVVLCKRTTTERVSA